MPWKTQALLTTLAEERRVENSKRCFDILINIERTKKYASFGIKSYDTKHSDYKQTQSRYVSLDAISIPQILYPSIQKKKIQNQKIKIKKINSSLPVHQYLDVKNDVLSFAFFTYDLHMKSESVSHRNGFKKKNMK